MSTPTELPRVLTGVPGLDSILSGGLPHGHMYLLEGEPGTGKTTTGMQFVIEGRRLGEWCLYVTLSESKAELEATAISHVWSLDGIAISEFIPDEASNIDEERYTVFHPGDVELASTIKRLLVEIEQAKPERFVIDSLSEFRLLAQDPIRYRRQLLVLKQFFAGHKTTVVLLNHQNSDGYDQQILSIMHGVIRLSKIPRSYGVTRRHLEVARYGPQLIVRVTTIILWIVGE